jgi:multicomponent K+:H+ antiporter subunit F
VVNIIALIVIYGIAFGTGVFFEAAMLFAMMGFISTVAYCRYILRGNIIE